MELEWIVKVAGLFAGVGGIELGFAEAGHEAVLLCEAWAPAQAVLQSRFSDVPAHGDVVTLTSLPGETEIVAAGFPCQDLSQAGLTRGIDGLRSGLVGQVFRLIESRPAPLIVLENVSFMLQLAGGRAMQRLVDAFEERRYRWAYRVVSSLGFLPQRRERVFFVASRCDVDPWDVLFVDDMALPKNETRLETHAHGFYWTEGTRGLGWAPDAIPTLKNGSTIGIPSPPAIILPSGLVVKPDLRDAERLQGFPAGWTEAAEVSGKRSVRWSLVGNAVSVPVATWLGRRLIAPGRYAPREMDRPLHGSRWPTAARGDGRARSAVLVGKYPVVKARPALHDFLVHDGTPLSARATRGFLDRAAAGRLRFVPGFLDRMRSHCAAMEMQRVAAE